MDASRGRQAEQHAANHTRCAQLESAVIDMRGRPRLQICKAAHGREGAQVGGEVGSGPYLSLAARAGKGRHPDSGAWQCYQAEAARRADARASREAVPAAHNSILLGAMVGSRDPAQIASLCIQDVGKPHQSYMNYCGWCHSSHYIFQIS